MVGKTIPNAIIITMMNELAVLSRTKRKIEFDIQHIKTIIAKSKEGILT